MDRLPPTVTPEELRLLGPELYPAQDYLRALQASSYRQELLITEVRNLLADQARSAAPQPAAKPPKKGKTEPTPE
jgi:hypothetical protein